MDYIAVLALFFVTVFAYYMIWGRRRYGSLPPGPPGYPIIGNILDLIGHDMRDVFTEWRRKYGDIFTVKYFGNTFIVVNGYEALREIFVKRGDVFSERPAMKIIQMTSPGEGFWTKKSRQWKFNRKFCLRVFKNFGMGTNIMQARIQNEAQFLISAIVQQKGEPFNIRPLFNNAVANVVCSVVFGKRFDYGDPVFQDITKRIHENMMTPVFSAMPFFRYIPGDPFHIRRFFTNQDILYKHYLGMIDKHLNARNNTTGDNLIDDYISEMRGSTMQREDESMNRGELATILSTLVNAGTDTTATTLTWALVYMLNDASVQSKLQNELDDAICINRLPSVDDKTKLPYLDATTQELLRKSCIVPFSVPHAAIRDTEIRGNRIPKDAVILQSLHSVLMDEELWTDPLSFRPERFLEEDGTVKQVDELIPFSFGRRTCLGESLGKMELFLFLVALVQRFEFSIPEGANPPPMEGKIGVTVSPCDFLIRAVPRKMTEK